VERVRIFGLGASVFTLLVVCGLFFVGLVYYIVLTVLGRQPRSAEMKARGETVFLPLWMREYWDWTIGPGTRLLIRLHASPDAISWASLAFSVAAGGAFAARYFGLGGWLYICCGTCDMFDGKVARATGRSSKAGAFLDSVLDRYTEMFVLAGLAYAFRDSRVLWAAIAGLGGSLMVSYTRARGEGLGYSCREGGMQRAERIVYISLSGIFGKVAEAVWSGHAWSVTFMAMTVTLLAVSANYTALQRFVAIQRHFREEEQSRVSPESPELRSSALRKVGP
jgi:phosphatidylglycerophosphate synthase